MILHVRAVREPGAGGIALMDIFKLEPDHGMTGQASPEGSQAAGDVLEDFVLPSLRGRYFYGADSEALGRGSATGRLRDAITSRAPRAKTNNVMTTRMNARIRFDPPLLKLHPFDAGGPEGGSRHRRPRVGGPGESAYGRGGRQESAPCLGISPLATGPRGGA